MIKPINFCIYTLTLGAFFLIFTKQSKAGALNRELSKIENIASSSCDVRYFSYPTDKPVLPVEQRVTQTRAGTFKQGHKPAVPQKQAPTPPPSEIDQWIGQYSEQYGVDKDKMKKIAYCESTYNPNAVNGPYGGMYQFHPRTWRSTRNEMGLDPNPDLRFDAEESIKTTAYKIAKQGTGPWPVCGKG